MKDSYHKWIEAGNELFAAEGPEGFKVEKLARQIGMNKSGFYHYFGDRESFISVLVAHHLEKTKLFYNELPLLQCFDPDYINLIIKYKTLFRIQIQLRQHSDVPLFKKAFDTVRKRNDGKTLHLWASYVKLPVNDPLVLKWWDIARDACYVSLVHEKNLNYEFMKELLEGIKAIIVKLQNNSSED